MLRNGKYATAAAAHFLRARLAAFALLFSFLPAACAVRATNDGQWRARYQRLTQIAIKGAAFRAAPVGDWTYDGDAPTNRGETAFSASVHDLQRIWLVVDISPGSLIGHLFLLFQFQFQRQRLVAASAEARLRPKQAYFAPSGALGAYDLFYGWTTARDALSSRALELHKNIWVYPLALSPARRERALRRVLMETSALTAHARLYNSLFVNCATEPYRALGLGWHYSVLLTALAPNHLFAEGLIRGKSMAKVNENANVTALVHAIAHEPDIAFNSLLLRELDRRFAEAGPAPAAPPPEIATAWLAAEKNGAALTATKG